MQRVDSHSVTWPSAFDTFRDEEGPLETFDARVRDVKRAVLALVTTLLVIGAVATLFVSDGLAFDGKQLSFEERANAMVSTDVVSNLLTSSDPSRFEWTVAEGAEISYPAGTVSGPEGAQALASRIGGENLAHVQVVDVTGDEIIVEWRLSGPIAPGVLVFESVAEGSAIAGVAELTVVEGQVQNVTIESVS